MPVDQKLKSWAVRRRRDLKVSRVVVAALVVVVGAGRSDLERMLVDEEVDELDEDEDEYDTWRGCVVGSSDI